MPTLLLRGARESETDALLARIRECHSRYGEGKVAPRADDQLRAAVAHGLVLYCHGRSADIQACCIMFDHLLPREKGGGSFMFVEAGGAAVKKPLRKAKLISLLLALATMSALHRDNETARDKIYFLVSDRNQKHYGLYRKMPASAARLAIAAAAYTPEFPINIGGSHHYYEFNPAGQDWDGHANNHAALAALSNDLVRRFEAGVTCGESTLKVRFEEIRRDLLRWGI